MPPLFLSEDEFLPIADDAAAIVERADACIRDIIRHFFTVRAEAKAASTCADQTLYLLGQKYSSIYDEVSRLEAVPHLATTDSLLTAFADGQADKAKTQSIEVTETGEKNTKHNYPVDIYLLGPGVESQDISEDARGKLSEDARKLEGDLAEARKKLLSLQFERDKLSLELDFIREMHAAYENFNHWSQQNKSVSAINVELTHLIADYKRRLQECSDSSQSCEENSRKLSMKVPLQESKSKEAKLTRNLISEKEDDILIMKLNDALQAEAHAKNELEKHKKYYFVKKKRLRAKIVTLKKATDVIHHKNQALQNHIEGSKNTGNITSEHAKKDQEKDTRIQTLVKNLENKEEELKRQRDDHNSQQNNCKSTRKLVYDILQKVKQDRTKVDQEISQLKNDRGIFVELDTYFQSVDVFEKYANSIMNEGEGTQTVTTESTSVDTSVPADVSGCTKQGNAVQEVLRMKDTRPSFETRLERTAGTDVEGEREGEGTQTVTTESTSVDTSVPDDVSGCTKQGNAVQTVLRRKLQRPSFETRLERTAGTDVGKNLSSSHEPELSADTSAAPSGRKRLASSQPEPRDRATSVKKQKLAEALEGTPDVLTTILPYAASPDTVVQQSIVETDHAPTLSPNEMVNEAKVEGESLGDTKEEIEGQQKPNGESPKTEDANLEPQYEGMLPPRRQLRGVENVQPAQVSSQSAQRSIVVKKNDQAAPDSALCSQTTETFRKSSPASLSQALRRSPCPGPSTIAIDEPAPTFAVGRTININERAMTPQTPRGGRGRATGVRGTRGARGRGSGHAK